MFHKDNELELNLGEQPIKQIMFDHNLKPHNLVEVSTEQITHRMVARANKGRRLTLHIRIKILNALNKAANKTYTLKNLFNY